MVFAKRYFPRRAQRHGHAQHRLPQRPGLCEGTRAGQRCGRPSAGRAGAFWADLGLELPKGEEKNHYENLTDLMTPIIKAYCSDVGFRVCETAIQCLGGYGYCKDYPLEQYMRDAKIMSLYEGTNGIQSMDLMGRKMILRGGACLES